jgi:hypothetical protein
MRSAVQLVTAPWLDPDVWDGEQPGEVFAQNGRDGELGAFVNSGGL